MTDSEEKFLEEYEKDNEWFYGHWVWKKIGLTPQELFKKIENIKDQLPVHQQEWEKLLKQAEEKHKKLIKNKSKPLELTKITNSLKG